MTLPVTFIRGIHYRHSCNQLPHYVYALFGADKTLLYVGSTYHVEQRLLEHARDKIWWTEVAEVEYSEACCYQVAIANESSLIRKHQPRCNGLPTSAKIGWETRRRRQAEWLARPRDVDVAS